MEDSSESYIHIHKKCKLSVILNNSFRENSRRNDIPDRWTDLLDDSTVTAFFIRPSSDGTYYGMVMSVRPSVFVSVRPTLRPSVRLGLLPPVFHTFLQHALTYWAEMLHMTLFYCTTDQVRVSSISVKFCGSYAPFVTYNTGNTQFSALYSYMLWHIELKLCIWLCLTVLQIKFECCQFASIFVGVMPPFGT